MAADRLRRLAQEEGLSLSVGGGPTVAMGPQRPETLLSLLQECADSDGGLLTERSESLGLQYRPRGARYNQRAALELDYSAGHIAPPLDPRIELSLPDDAVAFVDRHWPASATAPAVLVNISGSVVIGLFAALTGPEGKWVASTNLRYFVMAGICGGYTTFSSFSLQTLNLIRDRQLMYAGANILLSVVLCLIGVWLGYVLGGTLNHPTR